MEGIIIFGLIVALAVLGASYYKNLDTRKKGKGSNSGDREQF